MDGWVGNILRVDLTRGDYSVEDLDPDLAKDYIGGRGLATKFLCDEIDPMIDPLGPENRLIIATGPLTGTGAITGARSMVVAKSALNDLVGCANMGGHFGPELKFAGYDMIIFEGKSPEPVYLSIENDDVRIRPAKGLWGKGSVESIESEIKSELEAEWNEQTNVATIGEWKARETHVISIGPAAENLVKFASIRHSGGAAARCGIGAVMGSKNLKAVAVRGTKRITIADKDGFRKARRVSLDRLYSGQGQTRSTWGTWFLIEPCTQMNCLATRNFQAGIMEGAADANAVKAELFIRSKGCYACPLQTYKKTKVTDPKYQGAGKGPEFECWAALGSCCGVTNTAAIAKASYLCDDMGVDCIAMGVTIACAMDLYERGFLPEKDVGFKLNFGNAEAVIELIKQTALRQGFGAILAEGGYRLAEKYGHPELFMGVKKHEMPVWHPQGMQDTGLMYATSNCGAHHNRAAMSVTNILETKGAADWVKWGQDYEAIIDSSGLCWASWLPFVKEMVPVCQQEVLALLESATGAGYTLEDMLLAGERIWNLERQFLLKVGYTGKDDTLPPRMLNEPQLKGPAEGQVVRLHEMLPEYYKVRGWDENGVPTQEKLAQLGLA